jgi:hypothetical protein
MVNYKWLRRDNFPVICGCCGTLVISCWECGHHKACDSCRSHFWRNGPKQDKPCNGINLGKGLRGENGSPYEVAQSLQAEGKEATEGETVLD